MSEAFDPQPVLLEGRHVRLEPFEPRHLPLLQEAARGQDVFTWFLTDSLSKPEAMEKWFNGVLAAHRAGDNVAFATVRRADGRVVGATTYLDIRRPNRGLEIGNTWLRRDAQRTALNTEAKYLMLRHAFDALGAVRVQLKTDERNERSRAAILRLGAKFEGVLRRYQVRFDGFVRNTAIYSITAEEWPGVRAGLEARLARGA
jgi:RimJ/RimL family protein N-acetyltransferase